MVEKPTKTMQDSREGDDDWRHLAWRAWLHGVRNYAALGRQFDKEWRTVKRAIIAQSQAVRDAIDSGEVEALAEYVDGLHEDLSEADGLFRSSAIQDNAKLGALKHRSDLREKIAAAMGVVTRRRGVEHAGRLTISEEAQRADDEELIAVLRNGNHPNGSESGDSAAGGEDSGTG